MSGSLLGACQNLQTLHSLWDTFEPQGNPERPQACKADPYVRLRTWELPT